MNGLTGPMEYCGADRGHTGHVNNNGTVCGGYPPSDGGVPFEAASNIGDQLVAAVEVAEWWFTLRHGSPELNCPATGKAYALQGTVMGGLVALPPIMMCVSCGTALTMVDNGPTPPAGEDVNPEGAGSGVGV